MAAPQQTEWQPRVSYGMLREMSKAFGGVVPRTRRGKVRYGLRFCVDGVEYYSWRVEVARKMLPYTCKELAQECLEEIRGDIRRGMDPLAAISPYLGKHKIYAFERFWDDWIVHQKRCASVGEITDHYAYELSRYKPRGYLAPILEIGIHDVNYGALDMLKTHLLVRAGPSTARHVLSSIHACLKHLHKHRRGMPPAPITPTVRVPRHTPLIPSLADQRRLFDAIPWSIRGYWLARGLLGVRDEEAARALLSDYRRGPGEDADEWLIRGKGGLDRLLPVPQELARWVREHHPELAPAGTPLFVNPAANPKQNPDRKWLRKARQEVFHRAAASIGCAGKWKPNEALRHCFGTRTAERLLRGGASSTDAIRQVMAIMGHTTADTSTRYVQLGADSLRGALGEREPPQSGTNPEPGQNAPVKRQ